MGEPGKFRYGNALIPQTGRTGFRVPGGPLSGLGVGGSEYPALFGVGFQISPRYQVNAIRDGRKYRIQAIVDRRRFTGQVDDQTVAAYPGGLP